MKVPTVDQEVTPQAPSAPEAQAPRPVEAAYGAEAAEAQAGVGKAVSDFGNVLANHAAEQMKWAAEAKAFDGVSQLKEYAQNAMTNQDPTEIVDQDGNKRTVPSGYLQRNGYDAQGAYAQASADLRGQYNKILNTIPVPARASYSRFAQSAMDGFLEHVNTHEATEVRKATTSSLLAPLPGLVGSAAGITTPEHLEETVSQIRTMNSNVDKYNGLEEGTTENKNKATFHAVSNAVTSAVLAGDTDNAQKLLNSQSHNLDPESINVIQKQLETTARTKEHMDEFQANRAKSQVDTDFITRQNSGDITQRPTLDELNKAYNLGLVNQPGGMSEKVYNALIKQQNPEKLTPEQKDDLRDQVTEAAVKITTDDANTRLDPHARFEDIANYKAALVNAQGAYSPDQYQKRAGMVAKIFDKGLDQEVNKAYGNTNTIWDGLKKSLGYTIGAQPGTPEFKAAKAYLGHELMDRLAQGPIPDDQIRPTAQAIMAKYIASKNPEVLGAETTPHNVASKKGVTPLINPMSVVRTMGAANVEPTKPDYDPKTEKLQQNPVTKAYRVVKK